MWTFLFFLFVILVGGGWLIGKLLGSALFPNRENKHTFIDKSVHHHHHHHEHKNISIIDDVTKKKIFELKDKN
jgi:hypothetical protein